MNKIEGKKVKTCYGYEKFYWVIDDRPITLYLEEHRPDSLSAFGSLQSSALVGIPIILFIVQLLIDICCCFTFTAKSLWDA